MSKYKTIQTEFRNAESLKKALADLDCNPDYAPDLKVPSLHLYGYRSDIRPEVASIVIRRREVNRLFSGGASNDIGLAWNGKAYVAIISDYDSSASASFLPKLKQRYALHEVRRQAHAKGYTIRESAENGVIRLQLVRR
jgi:hypothetical protein